MGTKVQIENYLPGHCSMRDLSRESNGASWPSCYSDNNLPNEQFYYGFLPRTIADSHAGYDRDVLKQTMLEHEATFKNQVYELHRLYRVQRDLMDEVRRKQQFKHRVPYETSSSSSPVPSHMQSEDVRRWNGTCLPLANSACGKHPMSGQETVQSSPLSAKGKSIQTGPSPGQGPFQNCYSPKNSEVSESRPTKFRRRMLDLQLPADDYIDTDEVEYCGEASRSDSHVSRSKALADLNEPVHVEEMTVVSSVDFLGGAGSYSDAQYKDVSAKFLSSSKDFLQNSRHGGLNGTLNSLPFDKKPNGQDWFLPFDKKPNGQDWFSYTLESEQLKGGARHLNQGIHLEKRPVPSQPVQMLINEGCQPPAFLTNDPFTAKQIGNIQKSDRTYSLSSYNTPEPVLPSHVRNQATFFHPSDLGSSWARAGSCLNQKPMSAQSTPFLSAATLSKSAPSSDQSNSVFGNRWNLNSSPVTNAANGFYQGSSASFKELPVRFPADGFDYVNCNYSKGATCRDVNSLKDVNLNVPLQNGVSNSCMAQQGGKVIDNDQKSQDPSTVLPWLRGKGACSKEAENSRKGPFAVSSCDDDVKAKKPESSDCPSSRKILGVPILENPPIPKREEKSGWIKGGFDMNVPCEPTDSDLDYVAAEEAAVVEKKMQNLFDLNSCITEEEIPCLPSSRVNDAGCIKGGTGIDLEAPVMLEDEDGVLLELAKEPELPPERPDNSQAELAKSAAEAIVAMSSSANPNQLEVEAPSLPLESSLEEVLHWFVDIACSSGHDLERDKHGGDCLSLPEGLDDFESMTLRLKECDAEEYFPKPSIPNFPNLEDNSGPCVLTTTRGRRGHGRRGRQRRDFQRDILPGLTSLSRHEVTEDLQTFGGLMRATGHPWCSGPNRRNASRNGCARGRRRSVVASPARTNTVCATKQQSINNNSHYNNNTEVGLDDRSLTGWGKTTRRPRRQRCAAGNPPPPVALS